MQATNLTLHCCTINARWISGCSVENILWEATNTLWEAILSPIFWKIAVGDASHKFWKTAVRDGSHKLMNLMFSTRRFRVNKGPVR